MAAWTGVVALAALVWLAGANLPLHRFLIVALPVPVLGAVALLWLARVVSDRSVVAGRVIALGGCAVVVAGGALLWFHSPRPVLRTDRVRAAAEAGAYLDAAVPPGTAVAVVADDPASTLDILRQTFRAGIAPERIAAVTFRRTPTPRRAPVVLAARGYTADFDSVAASHPEGVVAPDVVVLAGPRAPGTVPPRPAGVLPGHPAALVALGLGTFAMLLATGLGWARAALRSLSPLALAGVAPAAGLAALVTGGLAADAVGLRLTPGTSLVVVLVAAAAGWVAAAVIGRRARPIPPAEPVSPTILSC
jgi:hypothetical protein